MSNSIWKKPDQRPGNIDRLVVRYLNDDTHYNICVDEVYNWSHVKEWCYLADLIAQADKAERLQKAVDLALNALDNIMETYDSKYDEPCNRFYDANIIATKAFDGIKQLIQDDNFYFNQKD